VELRREGCGELQKMLISSLKKTNKSIIYPLSSIIYSEMKLPLIHNNAIEFGKENTAKIPMS
jgi:hypothetical protein